jgi:hypothetical protein
MLRGLNIALAGRVAKGYDAFLAYTIQANRLLSVQHDYASTIRRRESIHQLRIAGPAAEYDSD